METKISLGPVGFPAPQSNTAVVQPQKSPLPVREDLNKGLSLSKLSETNLEDQEEKNTMPKRVGTNRTFALPNIPKPRALEAKKPSFDLKQGMKARVPAPPLGGLPIPPSMLEKTQKELQADHSKEEALTQLATKTIVDVQRLEVVVQRMEGEFDKLRTEHYEVAAKLQNTIDYLNAVYLQVQMLNSQNMYMAWHGRLVEYNLASLAGVQLERDLLDQARNQVQFWQQQTMQKQGEAEAAFAKLTP